MDRGFLHRHLFSRPALGWWAVTALCLVTSLVFYADLSRLENPDGEKQIPLFPPGQNDFSYSYLGARAILAGVNPYHNDRPEFTHPIWPPADYGGFKQIYPPGNLLAHVPLAWWKDADVGAAGRIWFRLSLAELALIAILTWALCRQILRAALTAVWIPVLFACLALNTGVGLALERGQSDILVALLAWAAIVCFARGRIGLSAALVTGSLSMKGYALLLAGGLGLLALERGRWKAFLLGATGIIVVVVAPTRHLWGEAGRAIAFRKEMFWPVWYNHGFANAVHVLLPAAREKGRLMIIAFGLVVCGVAWVQVVRSRRAQVPGGETLWLTAFGTAALTTLIGYSGLSISYNLIMVLPGALVMVLAQQKLRGALQLPRWSQHAFGAGLLISLFMLFSYRLGGEGLPINGTGLPASAFGLIMILAILAAALIRALTLRVRPAGRSDAGKVSNGGSRRLDQ